MPLLAPICKRCCRQIHTSYLTNWSGFTFIHTSCADDLALNYLSKR